MTTKLFSLLTMLFVCFKFGESTFSMMSISSDKNSLLHNAAIKTSDLLGFVYDDANGDVAIPNCTAKDAATLTVNSDCTITASGDTTPAANAGKETVISDFLVTGTPVNVMVGLASTPPVVSTTTSVISSASTNLLQVTVVGGSPGQSTTDSSFLCHGKTADASGELFTANTDSSSVGQIQGASDQGGSFDPVMKCVAFTRSSSTVVTGVGTFVLIVNDHDDIAARFQLFASPSVVVFFTSINNFTNTTTKIGYIHGTDKCSTTNANLTFDATAQCKGAFTLKGAVQNKPYINFVYGYRNYYLTVSNATCVSTTSNSTSTATCDSDFVFKFKYSKTFIGFLLIYTFTILKNNQN